MTPRLVRHYQHARDHTKSAQAALALARYRIAAADALQARHPDVAQSYDATEIVDHLGPGRLP